MELSTATSRFRPATSPIDAFVVALAVLLLGYAIGGRGFAYVGLPPIFIGEVVLCLGVVTLLMISGWERCLNSAPMLLLLLFIGWGCFGTIPYLSRFGVDSLRDAMLWGYCVFAFIVSGIILAEPHRFVALLNLYRKFAILFLVLMPTIYIFKAAIPGGIPTVPGTGVPILSARRGAMMVHTASIAAYLTAGFAPDVSKLAMFAIPFLLMFTPNRAGILAFVLSFGIATILGGFKRVAVGTTALVAVAIVAIGIAGGELKLPGVDRSVSLDEISQKVTSVLGSSSNSRLDNSKTWRLEWWQEIVNYTVYGRYFWTGKGYGINLADDDGFQVLDESALRSPHNVHMTILARGGVPGLAIWLLVQGAWALCILCRYLECKKARDPRWSGVFLFLFCFWIAAMVQATFDVDLEGPMGAAWFWSMFGFGCAALELHRHCPAVLYADSMGARQVQSARGAHVEGA